MPGRPLWTAPEQAPGRTGRGAAGGVGSHQGSPHHCPTPLVARPRPGSARSRTDGSGDGDGAAHGRVGGVGVAHDLHRGTQGGELPGSQHVD